MRILVTGANGLLGQMVVRLCAGREGVTLLATSKGEERIGAPLQAINLAYRTLDITSKQDWEQALDDFRPDSVLHAAAMTQVDDCETQPERCQSLNVDAVDLGASACEARGIHFVLLSTDFVFDGQEGPYDETALPAPLSVYGHSKWQAEKRVQRLTSPWAIVRTVLVIGSVPGLGRSNIVLWAVDALRQGKTITVVQDQWRSPTWAEDLARGCLAVSERQATGIYHISGPEVLSVYDFVLRIAAVFGLDPALVTPISTAQLGQPAQRPPKTGFLLDKARADLNYEPHSLEEVIAHCGPIE